MAFEILLNEVKAAKADIQVLHFGHFPLQTKRKFQDLIISKKLVLNDFVPQQDAFTELQHADIALHFGSPEFDYALSTKLFEHLGLRKPTLSLNFGGDIDLIIKQFDLGVSVNLNSEIFNLKLAIKTCLKTQIGPETVELFSHKTLFKSFVEKINTID